MDLLLILFTLVILLAVLLFTVRSRVNLIFDSINSDMHLSLFWLYPLLKSVITREGNEFIMTVYLLNRKVFTKQIKPKQNANGSRNILRSLNPTDIHVNTQFGFRDPFVTGLACSAISAASQFFNVESLHQKPDFLTINDYIRLDATAKLNLGYSLTKLV